MVNVSSVVLEIITARHVKISVHESMHQFQQGVDVLTMTRVLEAAMMDTVDINVHEENVYYIGLQDIQQRKIVVDKLAEFVASKPFEYFQEECDKFPYGLMRPHNEARKTDNVAKNRYQGIYAYDDTRIKVKRGKNDYVNANFIDGFLKRNAYIASLGPMKKQMDDFGIF
ncbi:hypothetical protein DPMN_058744 [Dreissena polymorpha]|uniref:Tyrosine-protein phosphatase domain-containing protein n=1 Tax=Dreissena polymorpha TaxID=45954 RepID=A0A9D4HFU0_DREPO|nr:hypothetical protein DPMN_058744 [Dreissena polymorpha]